MGRIIWTEDAKRSKTDGTYEYYYTPELKEGVRGKIASIALVAPNIASGNVGGIGIFDGARYFPVRWKRFTGNQKQIYAHGCFPIIAGESVYAKITGTAVDADVGLTALGFSKRV